MGGVITLILLLVLFIHSCQKDAHNSSSRQNAINNNSDFYTDAEGHFRDTDTGKRFYVRKINGKYYRCDFKTGQPYKETDTAIL